MKRRQLILLLGGSSAAAASTGTGAFSSVSADREVSVNVVEDHEAYLGVKKVGNTVSSDEATKVVQIRNQFASPLTLTVTILERDEIIDEIEGREITVGDDESSDDGLDDDERNSDDGDNNGTGLNQNVIGVGQKAYIAVKAAGSGTGEFTVSFSGELKESGSTVETTDKFSVTAASPEEGITAVQFPGNSGNAKIFGDVDGTVTVTIHYDDGESDKRNVEIRERIGIDSDSSIDRIDVHNVGVFRAADKGTGNKVPRDCVDGED